MSRDGATIAVSNWGAESVSLLDPSSLETKAEVKVGSHPNEMLFAPDGRLFVANAGANSVSVVKDGAVVETIRTSANPKDLIGSTPDALALAPNGKTLFVANADNNDVAVVDISGKESRVMGFIPTGWYPSALAVSPDSRKLFVGTGKGLGFRANAPSQTPYLQTNFRTGARYDYIGGVLSGAVSVVEIPDAKRLAEYTKQVMAFTPKAVNASPEMLATLHKIKHVVYVIRENRTYDQVFGDVTKGNGDASLVLFGRSVTPNAHKLADQFVLLDNLYCNGEVSQDGHEWCDASYATDYTEKAWVNSYAGRGQPTAKPELQDSPAGYLWDMCAKHGVSYMSYGEHSGFSSSRSTSPVYEGAKGLDGHASLAWSQMPSREVGGRDYQKMDVFIADLKKAEQTGVWPSFMIMGLPEDHTSGLGAGLISPDAAVASNDLAIGKMVDAISHSKFWGETAIFMIEDDAQDGPDHVDAHRTVGLAISPYIKRGSVDGTMYSTASMVRTMELILGLPPMTQFDEKATPMFGCFTSKPDFTPYSLIDETVALDTRNPRHGELAQRSAKLDLTDIDRADPDELNRILWAALKPGQKMPAPVRSLWSR
jgi:YVTN family beta-propeller protein